ncbi:MAG: SPOR domain-containing protein [Treponema sp.]|nr:SPOR domain-containing protein [Treponema sp.]
MRKLSAVILFCFIVLSVHAGSMDTGAKSAMTLRANALLKDDVQQSLSYLTSHIVLASSERERRSILYYTGTLQELLGYYAEAAVSYADAAAINEEDAKGMPKATNEQLYLYAARASLGAGDFVSADKYLDSLPVIYSKETSIIAQKRLYSAWSALCKAEDFNETKGVIANLESFAEDSSMKSVRSTVLFTLWYLTNDKSYADSLKKDYPLSPEVSIINGKNQVMTIPFWYFVPRASAADANPASEAASFKSEAESIKPVSDVPENEISKNEVSKAEEKKSSEVSPAVHSRKKQQTGFFKIKENADKLISRLDSAGFEGYILTETRSDGEIRYLVVVDENESLTMGKKLKAAGFDCYMIEK